MIKICNLTKIYNSKNKDKCVAVDDISLTIESKGFVFIIGKSGSGKTTLLGLIGGLDSATSGDIIVDGTSFKKFKDRDFINYRNQTIGYVFQDFHLINELTIEENIALSLDLQNINYEDKINKALKSVDLIGYNKRYPKELSGGEKQRVAIARALVKNPKIILADEPTGNLDTKTTKQILDLLKKLSEERLVLMVSHSLSDANDYADRIIELSNGKIINDYIRNEEYCYHYQIKNEELILPINRKIYDKEIIEINDALSKGNIKKISQTEDVFVKNNKVYEEGYKDTKLKKTKFNLAKLFKLSFTFLKTDLFKLFIYSFVVACLIVILGLAQLIVNFDSAEVIEKEMANINQNTIALKKTKLIEDEMFIIDDTKIMDITKEDIQKFYDNGYTGKIYELLTIGLDYGATYNFCNDHQENMLNPVAVYHSGTRGVLVTDKDYVKSIYGEVKYLVLAKEQKDYGFYITDYTADAILLYTNNIFKSYEDLLGNHKSMGGSIYAYINGIIETGYKEKHKEVIAKLQDVSTTKDEILKLTKEPEYLAFYDDVIQNYSVSYAFNSDFKEKYLDQRARTWVPLGNSTLTVNGIPVEAGKTWFQLYSQHNRFDLKDNEVVMSLEHYNSMFKTNYQATNINNFIPHEATLTYYHQYDEMRVNPLDTFTIKIIGLSTERSFASDMVFDRLLELTTFTHSIYFANESMAKNVLTTAKKQGFMPNSILAYSISTMTKAVDVFSDFFNIIFIGLCVCAVIILVNYGLKLIRERRHDIGVLKALGIKEKDLTFIFGLHILLLIILVIVMYVLGSVIFIDLSNEILYRSLVELAPNYFLMDIDVLFLKSKFILENSVLVTIIVILSFIAPLFSLKFLKPSNIIKAKE